MRATAATAVATPVQRTPPRRRQQPAQQHGHDRVRPRGRPAAADRRRLTGAWLTAAAHRCGGKTARRLPARRAAWRHAGHVHAASGRGVDGGVRPAGRGDRADAVVQPEARIPTTSHTWSQSGRSGWSAGCGQPGRRRALRQRRGGRRPATARTTRPGPPRCSRPTRTRSPSPSCSRTWSSRASTRTWPTATRALADAWGSRRPGPPPWPADVLPGEPFDQAPRPR